jgi:hypothetical protein
VADEKIPMETTNAISKTSLRTRPPEKVIASSVYRGNDRLQVGQAGIQVRSTRPR